MAPLGHGRSLLLAPRILFYRTKASKEHSCLGEKFPHVFSQTFGMQMLFCSANHQNSRDQCERDR